MLVLQRRRGEKVYIGVGDVVIEVEVVERGTGSLKLGFTAPADVKVLRGELVGPAETVEAAMRRGRE